MDKIIDDGNYLRDVPNTLAIVSAVRIRNTVQYLQVERRTLNLVFAFDHINYARFNSLQSMFLRNLSRSNRQVFEDFLQYGLEASSTGD